jgi:hypothetical protein
MIDRAPAKHRVLLTIHPAALLRMPADDRETAYPMLIGDLMPIKNMAQ